MTRGERNNNPTNLVRNGTQWLGMRANQTDARFCQFETAIDGIRAAFINMRTHVERAHGSLTVAGLVSLWAPPVENDTDHYTKNVCDFSHMQPSDLVDFSNRWVMVSLMDAIIREENGRCIYTITDMSKAYDLAQRHNGEQTCLSL